MKRVFLFLFFLAGAVAVSAWLGVSDAKTRTPAALNTSRQRDGLRDGEILVWAPGQDAAPPPARRTAAPVPEAAAGDDYYEIARRLLPLARPLGAPRRGEWRGEVREPEQDLRQFLNEARARRGTLVILPVGDMPNDQRSAIGHMLDTLSAFFGLPAACTNPVPLEKLPAGCFRMVRGRIQINAEALMALVLRPNVRGDVAAILAVTDLDIYPGGNWPFESAFGWSSFSEGAAAVSTYSAVEGSNAHRGRNLLRLCKLGVHELAHTFGLKHCATYNCLMNGCGTIRENDAKPLVLCPDCLVKLSLATGRDPLRHLEDMLGLCRAKGFAAEAGMYQRALRQLR